MALAAALKDSLGSGLFKAESDGLVHRAYELLRGILTPVSHATRAVNSRQEASPASPRGVVCGVFKQLLRNA